jgi:beta-glucosidase
VSKQSRVGEDVNVTVDLENSGARAGEEVVELYLKNPKSDEIRTLQGFERIALRAKEHKTVHFSLKAAQFAHVTETGAKIIDPGTFEITAGGKQTGGVSARFELTGAAKKVD